MVCETAGLITIDAIEGADNLPLSEWRHGILQGRQLTGDISRNEVRAGGEQLAKLDEDWPQFLQCFAQANRAGLRKPTPKKYPPNDAREHPRALMTGEKFVEPVAIDDGDDLEEAESAHEAKILACCALEQTANLSLSATTANVSHAHVRKSRSLLLQLHAQRC